MNFGQTVTGQQNTWRLVNKLGEGDAGEVYLVETLLEGRLAILKRPRKSPLSREVLRQAAQIKKEGQILKALKGIPYPDLGTMISTPVMIDHSLGEEGPGEHFFIVIEQAAGFDLKALQQYALFGVDDEGSRSRSAEDRFFIQGIAALGAIPAPVLVRSLFAVIHFLETIHSAEVLNEGAKQYGVIWNDIKPEHLYWDAQHGRLMIIDWGNSGFLEVDGITKDRQHSRLDDYHQFIQSMGGFLSETNPELYARLEWPQGLPLGGVYQEGVKPLKDRLAPLLAEALNQVEELRSRTADLYAVPKPELEHLAQSDQLHRQSIALGVMPDFSSAINLHARVALQMASEYRLPAFKQVCEKTATLTTASPEKWDLLGELAAIFQQQDNPEPRERVSNILIAGVVDDWPALLWSIFEMIGQDALPDWWETVSQAVRRIHLKLDPEAVTPSIAASRLYFTLRAAVLQMGDKPPAPADSLQAQENLLKIFNEEVVKKWKDLEPAPPNSGIGYNDIDGVLEAVEAVLPGTRQKIEIALAQPKAHAEIALNAWERKDFETSRKALYTLLLWDPDRRRLLQADRAIGTAAQWLAKVRNGAATDEPFYDFLTSVELAGRNLRNQVGGAKWLDITLDALRRLRKGTRPVDLMMEYPGISNEIPWLNEHRSREILTLPRSRPLTMNREGTSPAYRTIVGTVDGKFGADRDLLLAEPLDTWTPEARGSSARVFAGYFHSQGSREYSSAIKIMRPGHIDYALPLFKEEAQILSLLRDVPGVTPLIECGFLRLDEGMTLPRDDGQVSASHLRGLLQRYGAEEVLNFLASMDRQIASGWLPYLALAKRNQEHNLMKYCDAGYTHGWFLPLGESLLLAIQICDILQSAHERNIVYRDHKILHYYWDADAHGVAMIDWNISKRQPQGLSDAERQSDLVQFGARALHHILTGRPAPGALPLGPNRPEEIEQAALSYTVSWTYDDERLPNRVKEILEQTLNQGYAHARDLRSDLAQVYQQTLEPVEPVQPVLPVRDTNPLQP